MNPWNLRLRLKISQLRIFCHLVSPWKICCKIFSVFNNELLFLAKTGKCLKLNTGNSMKPVSRADRIIVSYVQPIVFFFRQKFFQNIIELLAVPSLCIWTAYDCRDRRIGDVWVKHYIIKFWTPSLFDDFETIFVKLFGCFDSNKNLLVRR